MVTDVTFTSDSLQLAGTLRTPAGAGPFPAVVFTGPLSGVKEQVVATYAEKLTDAGFLTLAFDHRNFGASAGEPRQHENHAGKFQDLRDATTFLAAHPAVDADRIGCVGICLGGGIALRYSAFDPRIRALATVAGGYNSPTHDRAVLSNFIAAEGYWGAVAGSDYDGTVMGGDEPYDYYGTDRAPSRGWVNRLTVRSVYELMTTDLAGGAEFISPTPWLLVHGDRDAYCTPEQARATFARAGEPKWDVWLPADLHIDLYDNPKYVDPAADAIVAWFGEHLV